MSLLDTLLLSACSVALAASCVPPAGPTSSAPAPHAAPADAARRLTFNGRAATERDLQIVAQLEAAWGVQVPPGDYWYDDVSGAAGLWGGPTRGFLAPGLGLGGPLPAGASGGGSGAVTGVFVNGRELHPLDVQGLARLLGQAPWPGQWWVDAQGNFGPVGQPAMGNLVAIARQRGGGDSYYRGDVATGSSVFVGDGCAAVTGRLSPSDTDSSYSYYVGCD